MVMAEECSGLLSTPALVVDVPTVDRNIQRMASYAKQHGLALRPHTKTHKSRWLSRKQMAAGACGLTVAKVGEARILAGDCDDLFIAYTPVDGQRSRRIAELALTGKKVTITVDSVEGVDAMHAAARDAGVSISVLVDHDIGFHRTGVATPAASVELARHVSKCRSLQLAGLFFYPGHLWSTGLQQQQDLLSVDAQFQEIIAAWKSAGLPVGVVSGGSTPTAFSSHLMTTLTEIRPGTYVFNDLNTLRGGFCTLDDCAAGLVCTVISTTVPGKAVIDAGTKTLTSDRNITQPDSGHGYVLEYPDVRVVRLSEEHGELDLRESSRTPRVGERITIIPNHICPCVNLQNAVWLRHDDGRLEAATVDTRGELT